MGENNMTLRLCSRCENRRREADLLVQNGVRICDDCREAETEQRGSKMQAESLPSAAHRPSEPQRAADEQYDIAKYRF